MNHLFSASLVYKGLIGGRITLSDTSLTYRNGKLTLPKKLRDLELPYGDIRTAGTVRMLCLPSVTFSMKNGESYRFIIFGRNRFLAVLKENGIRITERGQQ